MACDAEGVPATSAARAEHFGTRAPDSTKNDPEP